MGYAEGSPKRGNNCDIFIYEEDIQSNIKGITGQIERIRKKTQIQFSTEYIRGKVN